MLYRHAPLALGRKLWRWNGTSSETWSTPSCQWGRYTPGALATWA